MGWVGYTLGLVRGWGSNVGVGVGGVRLGGWGVHWRGYRRPLTWGEWVGGGCTLRRYRR